MVCSNVEGAGAACSKEGGVVTWRLAQVHKATGPFFWATQTFDRHTDAASSKLEDAVKWDRCI